MSKLPEELLKRIKAVTNRRARFVLDKIVKNGAVTTEDIRAQGYNHPPRAARDARELGFVLKMIRVKGSDGRSIAAYELDPSATLDLRKAGRRAIPKKLRDRMIKDQPHCTLCGAKDNLQIDHRVPFEIAGERDDSPEKLFMVACGSCQRRKSWECEHCPNVLVVHDERICETCYWASPDSYQHVATRPERRIQVAFSGAEEIKVLDSFSERAKASGLNTVDAFKKLIRESGRKNRSKGK